MRASVSETDGQVPDFSEWRSENRWAPSKLVVSLRFPFKPKGILTKTYPFAGTCKPVADG